MKLNKKEIHELSNSNEYNEQENITELEKKSINEKNNKLNNKYKSIYKKIYMTITIAFELILPVSIAIFGLYKLYSFIHTFY